MNLKKRLIPLIPYFFIGLYASKIGQAWRLTEGADLSAKLMNITSGFGLAFQSPLPSFHPADLCMEISLLTAFAVLPVLTVAAAQKGYILPVCLTLIYTFLGFILLMVNMYLHPLSSMTAIVMYDIPGVVFDQPLNIPAAFLCIGVWAAASAVLANVALVRRK